MAHSQSVVSHIYYTYFQKHTYVMCACQICTSVMELNGISINSRLRARRANCSNDMSPHVMLPRRDVRRVCVLQEEPSTWCAGTRTRRRRPGPTLWRRREIKYSMTHPWMCSKKKKTWLPQPSKWLWLTSVPLQEVFVHILDLSETKKVWEFAEGFKKKYKTLNVLVRVKDRLKNMKWLHERGYIFIMSLSSKKMKK